HTLPNSGVIQAGAVKFLLKQKTPNWTWNYWQKNHPMRAVMPLPDDLDDTIWALIALALHNPKLISGSVLAHLARTLTACETAPGGPYRTWLVDRTLHKTWGDVDIAVNANIGYLLSQQQVRLSGLMRYIDDALARNQLTSPY